MKKTLIVFSLLFVLCVPRLSYAEINQRQLELLITKLEPKIQMLYTNQEEWTNIMVDMAHIAEKLESFSLESKVYQDIRISMTITRTELCCICESLNILPIIKNDEVLSYTKRRFERIPVVKRRLEESLKLTQEGYPFIKNKAALFKLDKAKDIMREVLGVYDKIITILENSIPKISKE